VLTFLLIIQGA